MFRTFVLSGLLAFSTVAAQAAVMHFDDVTGSYTPFEQTLGDIPHLDVSNNTLADFGNTTQTNDHIAHWLDNYSDLTDVAFPANNGDVGQMTFTPDAGYAVTISSWDVGTYPNGANLTGSFYIYDAAWTVLWSLANQAFSGNSVTLAANVTSTGPLHFQWGTNWNIGIDNFEYSVSPVVSAVPLPASGLLLAGGLGLLAMFRRRRRETDSLPVLG